MVGGRIGVRHAISTSNRTGQASFPFVSGITSAFMPFCAASRMLPNVSAASF